MGRSDARVIMDDSLLPVVPFVCSLRSQCRESGIVAVKRFARRSVDDG